MDVHHIIVGYSPSPQLGANLFSSAPNKLDIYLVPMYMHNNIMFGSSL